MSEMVERVARAIARNHDIDPDWGSPPMWQTPWLIADARAAIEAMREPTEKMDTAGFGALPLADGYSLADDFKKVWYAAIDAALE